MLSSLRTALSFPPQDLTQLPDKEGHRRTGGIAGFVPLSQVSCGGGHTLEVPRVT